MRLTSNRALLGAIAMILVGIVLSMMSGNYITRLEADGLTRSRWWWELVLNSQILCAAFIWFSHIDRVKAAGERIWLVRFLQMIFGMIAVLLPVWIAVAAAVFGWFEARPDRQTIDDVFLVCISVWFGVAFIMWLLECKAHRRWIRPWFARRRYWHLAPIATLPTVAAVALTVVELVRGGTQHYIYIPFLLYLQGAVPYVVQSIRFKRA